MTAKLGYQSRLSSHHHPLKISCPLADLGGHKTETKQFLKSPPLSSPTPLTSGRRPKSHARRMTGSLLMFGLFISTFQLGSVWNSPLMTDETVGPELPAATGGWTNGRARGWSFRQEPIMQAWQMPSGGQERAQALPSHSDESRLWPASSCDSLISVAP